MFSSYVTATIIDSETRDDLAQGIIQVITPIRHCDTVQVRVDQYSAFKSLAASSHPDLRHNGIVLELSNDGNKNSNCRVDKMMQELQEEIKRLSSNEDKISTG